MAPKQAGLGIDRRNKRVKGMEDFVGGTFLDPPYMYVKTLRR